MVNEVEQLISEIVQIKDQYVAEVGRGRRAWPKSIKDRVARLDEIGIAPKVVSSRTTIPYDTVVLWRYNRRHGVHGRLKRGFHELTVARPAVVTTESSQGRILQSAAVTVPEIKIPREFTSPATTGRSLRITTPNGFIIDGINETSAAQLIRQLSDQGGSHAS